jgi:hypothetical protein
MLNNNQAKNKNQIKKHKISKKIIKNIKINYNNIRKKIKL